MPKHHSPPVLVPHTWWSPGRVASWSGIAAVATVLGCFLTAVWLVGPTLLTYANLPADMAEVKASEKNHTSSLADMKYEVMEAAQNAAAAKDAAAYTLTLTRLIEANQEMTMRRAGIEPMPVNSLLPSASMTSSQTDSSLSASAVP